MPAHTQYLAPLSGAPRPALPIDHINPFVKSRTSPASSNHGHADILISLPVTPSNVPSVKFQEIIRDGQSTIVSPLSPLPRATHP